MNKENNIQIIFVSKKIKNIDYENFYNILRIISLSIKLNIIYTKVS